MKWIVTVLIIFALSVSTAFAGGDKNRGDKGKGNVNQHQNRN